MKSTAYYRGLDIAGEIVYSNGKPDFIEGMAVCSPDGDDITEMLTDKAFRECENALLEDL
jgi:hypothetical protein